MIAFCTCCFTEIDAECQRCPNCRADLGADSQFYEKNPIAALAHALPDAGARIYWLLFGENNIRPAVPDLRHGVGQEPDLFMQKSAIEALAAQRDPRSHSLFHVIGEETNYLFRSAIKTTFGDMDFVKGSHP